MIKLVVQEGIAGATERGVWGYAQAMVVIHRFRVALPSLEMTCSESAMSWTLAVLVKLALA